MMNSTIVAILFAFCLAASPSMAEESPSEVVRKFCQLDYDGARLSSETYAPIMPLIDYPVEPGWDTAVGIKGFAVKKEVIAGGLAEVTVEYDIDRIWPEGDPPSTHEIFKLVRSGHSWKIQEYILYPRVSAKFLCKKHSQCSSWANTYQAPGSQGVESSSREKD